MKRLIFSRVALATAVVAAMACSTASAQVVYHDAVVAGMSGTVNTTGPANAAGSATEWRIRGLNGGTDSSNFSNEGNALQYTANPIDASNPTLTTTVGGLDASKTYEVFVFYWDDVALNDASAPTLPATTPWDVAAKLSTDATYTQYDSSAGYIVTDNAGLVHTVDASAAGYQILTFSDISGLNVLGQGTDDFSDAMDGNRAMFGGLLPNLVSGVTSLSVDIQASPNSSQRSWYDGIGVRVIPEPSTFVLFGLGLAGVAMIRRQR